MIAVVDYGMGNLRSVANAFAQVGVPCVVTADRDTLASAPGIVLPGVGAFGDAMQELAQRGLRDIVADRAHEALGGGRPFLGICLGMQLLVESGEETPGVTGLGAIAGDCPRFRIELKVPHMGWNSVRPTRPGNPLLDGLGSEPWFYFVHSYHVRPASADAIGATCHYGIDFAAMLWKGNLHATQFHPEKSQAAGLRLYRNFGCLAGVAAAAVPAASS